jgi:8-oxo-dGTP pyrophosphatase MutT (NUDIX family)
MVAETDRDLTEALLEQITEALRSASDPLWYDPQYDVAIQEDATGIVASDRDINHLQAIAYALSAGLPVIGWGPAQRNPGADERLSRAVRQFVESALLLIEQFQAGTLTSTQFTAALSAAYLRQASNAYTVGKRSLGNLSRLSTQDQQDIQRTLMAAGLAPAETVIPVGSVGDLIGRLITTTNGKDPKQAKDAPAMEALLLQSVAVRMDDVMRKGFARAVADSENTSIPVILDRIAAERAKLAQANQTLVQQAQVRKLLAAIAKISASAQAAVRNQLAVVTRLLQSGRITPQEAAARVNAILHAQALRAMRAARRAAGARNANQLSADNQGDITDSMVAADAALHAKGGLLNWIVKNVLNPWNLAQPDTVKWLRALLVGGALNDFHSLAQAGERAAFRVGDNIAPVTGATPTAQTVADVANVQSAIGQDHVFSPTPMGQIIQVWWTLGDADHCDDCIELSDMSPYSYDALMSMGLFPGSGHTQCGLNCKCRFEYDVPDTVCGDPLAGISDFAESMVTEGPINLVWIKEADACGTPIPVASLLGDLPDYGPSQQPVADQNAFTWDTDVASQIVVDAPALALPEELAWLKHPPDLHAPYIRDGIREPGVGPVLVQKFALGDNTYSAVYQEDAKNLRFITGAMTGASSHTFEPEMTVAAIRWAAQSAAERGLSLQFDNRLVNQGLADFLNGLGAVSAELPLAQRIPDTIAAGASIFTEHPILPGPQLTWMREMPEMPSFRALAAEPHVSNANAIVQTAFEPSPEHPMADAMALFPGMKNLAGEAFSSAQWDMLRAKAELFDQLGIDRSLNSALSVIESSDGVGYAGRAFSDGRINLEPEMGLAGKITVSNTFGDAWAHEYGHLVSNRLSQRLGADRWNTFKADFRGDNLLKLKSYADTSDEEFWAEAFTAMTRPDYIPGTLAGDTEAWSLMREGGVWHTPEITFPVTKFGAFPTEQVLVDPSKWGTGGLLPGWKWGSADKLGKGTTPRVLLKDPTGQEFLLKPYGVSEEVAGSRVTTLFGLDAPPVARIAFGTGDNPWYAWQALVPRTAQSYWVRAPDAATLARVLGHDEERQLFGHGLVDYLIHNADGHGGNYLYDSGRVWAIDKGYGFDRLGSGLTPSLTDFYERADASMFGRIDHSPDLLLRLTPQDVATTLDRFDGVTDQQLLNAVGDALTTDAAKADLLSRKHNLRQSVEDLFADRTTIADHPSAAWKAWLDDGGTFPYTPPADLGATVSEVTNVSELVARMEARYPGTDWSGLLEVPFDTGKVLAKRMDMLFSRFGTIPSFRGVALRTYAPGKGTIAEVARIDPNVPGSKVFLNRAMFTDSTALQKAFLRDKANVPFSVGGQIATNADEWASDVVTHEMGHEWLGMNLHSRLGADRYAPVRQELEPWLKSTLWPALKTTHISKYARSNQHELWAETFAGAIEGMNQPETKQLAAIFDKFYPAKPADPLLGFSPQDLPSVNLTDVMKPKDTGFFKNNTPQAVRDAVLALPEAEREGATKLIRNMATLWKKDVSVVPTDWQVWLIKGSTFEAPTEVLPAAATLWDKKLTPQWSKPEVPLPPAPTAAEFAPEGSAGIVTQLLNPKDEWWLEPNLKPIADAAEWNAVDTGAINKSLRAGEHVADQSVDGTMVKGKDLLDYYDRLSTQAETTAPGILYRGQSLKAGALGKVGDSYVDKAIPFATSSGNKAYNFAIPGGVVQRMHVPKGFRLSAGEATYQVQLPRNLRWRIVRVTDGKELGLAENVSVVDLVPDTGVVPGYQYTGVPFKSFTAPPKPDTPFDGLTFKIDEKAPVLEPGTTVEPIPVEGIAPLNTPPVDWTGHVPEEPPLPEGAVADWQLKDMREAADKAWLRWEAVQSGEAKYAITWSQAESDAAKKAGLFEQKIGSQYYAAKSKADLDALDKAVKGGLDTNSDAFWKDTLGYSQKQLDTIDAYDVAKKGTHSLRAGVVLVEPDGRMWIISPRNRWAGYENTFAKGGVDLNETTAQAAVREAREEMGFSVELDKYLGDFTATDNGSITRYYVAHRTGGGPAWAKTIKETYSVRLGTPSEVRPVLLRYDKPDSRDTKVLDSYLEQAGLPPVAPPITEPPARLLGMSPDDVSGGSPFLHEQLGYDPQIAEASAGVWTPTSMPTGLMKVELPGGPDGTSSVFFRDDEAAKTRRWVLTAFKNDSGVLVAAADPAMAQLRANAMLAMVTNLPKGWDLSIEGSMGFGKADFALLGIPGEVPGFGKTLLIGNGDAVKVAKIMADPTALSADAPTLTLTPAVTDTLAAKLGPADPTIAVGQIVGTNTPTHFATHGVEAPADPFFETYGVAKPAWDTSLFVSEGKAPDEVLSSVHWKIGTTDQPINLFYPNAASSFVRMGVPEWKVTGIETRRAILLKEILRQADKGMEVEVTVSTTETAKLADLFTVLGSKSEGGSWRLDAPQLQLLRKATDQNVSITSLLPPPGITTAAMHPAAQAKSLDQTLGHVVTATPNKLSAQGTTGIGEKWGFDQHEAYNFVNGTGTGIPTPDGPDLKSHPQKQVWTTSKGGDVEFYWDTSPNGNLRLNQVITGENVSEPDVAAALVGQLQYFAGVMQNPALYGVNHLAVRIDDAVMNVLGDKTKQMLTAAGLKPSSVLGGWILSRPNTIGLVHSLLNDLTDVAAVASVAPAAFAIGDTVLHATYGIGTVIDAVAGGTFYVKFPSVTSYFLADQLKPIVKAITSLKPGDMVHTLDNKPALIASISADGQKALVKIGFGEQTFSIADLSLAHQWQIGDLVNYLGNEGSITKIEPDILFLKTTADGKLFATEPWNANLTFIGSQPAWEVGDTLVNGAGVKGAVTFVHADGFIDVHWATGTSPSIHVDPNATTLGVPLTKTGSLGAPTAPAAPSAAGFRVGDKVQSGGLSGTKGVIAAVFPDAGKVTVTWDSGITSTAFDPTHPNVMLKHVEPSATFKVGDHVANMWDATGTITNVADGKVGITWDISPGAGAGLLIDPTTVGLKHVPDVGVTQPPLKVGDTVIEQISGKGQMVTVQTIDPVGTLALVELPDGSTTWMAVSSLVKPGFSSPAWAVGTATPVAAVTTFVQGDVVKTAFGVGKVNKVLPGDVIEVTLPSGAYKSFTVGELSSVAPQVGDAVIHPTLGHATITKIDTGITPVQIQVKAVGSEAWAWANPDNVVKVGDKLQHGAIVQTIDANQVIAVTGGAKFTSPVSEVQKDLKLGKYPGLTPGTGAVTTAAEPWKVGDQALWQPPGFAHPEQVTIQAVSPSGLITVKGAAANAFPVAPTELARVPAATTEPFKVGDAVLVTKGAAFSGQVGSITHVGLLSSGETYYDVALPGAPYVSFKAEELAPAPGTAPGVMAPGGVPAGITVGAKVEIEGLTGTVTQIAPNGILTIAVDTGGSTTAYGIGDAKVVMVQHGPPLRIDGKVHISGTGVSSLDGQDGIISAIHPNGTYAVTKLDGATAQDVSAKNLHPFLTWNVGDTALLPSGTKVEIKSITGLDFYGATVQYADGHIDKWPVWALVKPAGAAPTPVVPTNPFKIGDHVTTPSGSSGVVSEITPPQGVSGGMIVMKLPDGTSLVTSPATLKMTRPPGAVGGLFQKLGVSKAEFDKGWQTQLATGESAYQVKPVGGAIGGLYASMKKNLQGDLVLYSIGGTTLGSDASYLAALSGIASFPLDPLKIAPKNLIVPTSFLNAMPTLSDLMKQAGAVESQYGWLTLTAAQATDLATKLSTDTQLITVGSLAAGGTKVAGSIDFAGWATEDIAQMAAAIGAIPDTLALGGGALSLSWKAGKFDIGGTLDYPPNATKPMRILNLTSPIAMQNTTFMVVTQYAGESLSYGQKLIYEDQALSVIDEHWKNMLLDHYNGSLDLSGSQTRIILPYEDAQQLAKDIKQASGIASPQALPVPPQTGVLTGATLAVPNPVTVGAYDPLTASLYTVQYEKSVSGHSLLSGANTTMKQTHYGTGAIDGGTAEWRRIGNRLELWQTTGDQLGVFAAQMRKFNDYMDATPSLTHLNLKGPILEPGPVRTWLEEAGWDPSQKLLKSDVDQIVSDLDSEVGAATNAVPVTLAFGSVPGYDPAVVDNFAMHWGVETNEKAAYLSGANTSVKHVVWGGGSSLDYRRLGNRVELLKLTAPSEHIADNVAFAFIQHAADLFDKTPSLYRLRIDSDAFLATSLSMRDTLKAYGGVLSKTNDMAFKPEDVQAIRDKLVADGQAPTIVTVAPPPVAPTFSTLGTIEGYDPQAIALASIPDIEQTIHPVHLAGTANKALKETIYGDGNQALKVQWRRIGQRIEVSSAEGDYTPTLLLAHMKRMAEAMETTPGIEYTVVRASIVGGMPLDLRNLFEVAYGTAATKGDIKMGRLDAEALLKDLKADEVKAKAAPGIAPTIQSAPKPVPATTVASSYAAGDHIVWGKGLNGFVTSVDHNGKLSVTSVSGTTFKLKPEDVTPYTATTPNVVFPGSKAGGYNLGDQVQWGKPSLGTPMQTGTVTQISQSGELTITTQSGAVVHKAATNPNLSKVAPAVSFAKGVIEPPPTTLAVGDKVKFVGSGPPTYEVMAVKPNGLIDVKDSDGNLWADMNGEHAVKVGVVPAFTPIPPEGLKVGDWALKPDGKYAKVMHTFDNGNVQLSIGNTFAPGDIVPAGSVTKVAEPTKQAAFSIGDQVVLPNGKVDVIASIDGVDEYHVAGAPGLPFFGKDMLLAKPAEPAGLKVGDIVDHMNGNSAYKGGTVVAINDVSKTANVKWPGFGGAQGLESPQVNLKLVGAPPPVLAKVGDEIVVKPGGGDATGDVATYGGQMGTVNYVSLNGQMMDVTMLDGSTGTFAQNEVIVSAKAGTLTPAAVPSPLTPKAGDTVSVNGKTGTVMGTHGIVNGEMTWGVEFPGEPVWGYFPTSQLSAAVGPKVGGKVTVKAIGGAFDGETGTITAISPDGLDIEVILNDEHATQVTFEPSELENANPAPFRIGEHVNYGGQNLTVTKLFPVTGNVQAMGVDGTPFVLVPESVNKGWITATTPAPKFAVGDKVLTNDYGIGTIAQVNSATVEVSFDPLTSPNAPSSKIYNPAKLTPKPQIKVGDSVLTYGGDEGVVNYLSPDGLTAHVTTMTANLTQETKDLTLVKVQPGFHQGDWVTVPTGQTGKIAYVTDDGTKANVTLGTAGVGSGTGTLTVKTELLKPAAAPKYAIGDKVTFTDAGNQPITATVTQLNQPSGMVIVTSDVTGYPLLKAESDLTPFVAPEPVPATFVVGDKVKWTPTGTSGVVTNVSDNAVTVKWEGSGTVSTAKGGPGSAYASIVKPVPSAGETYVPKPGDTVAQPLYGTGTVIEKTPYSPTAMVDFGANGKQLVGISTLTKVEPGTVATVKASTAPAGLKVGDQVTHPSFGTGTVTEVSSGSTVLVDWDTYPKSWTNVAFLTPTGVNVPKVVAPTLSKAALSAHKLAVGDWVLKQDGNYGKIVKVFKNGKAKVTIQSYGSGANIPMSQLSYVQTWPASEVAVGDTVVYYTGGKPYVVTEIPDTGYYLKALYSGNTTGNVQQLGKTSVTIVQKGVGNLETGDPVFASGFGLAEVVSVDSTVNPATVTVALEDGTTQTLVGQDIKPIPKLWKAGDIGQLPSGKVGTVTNVSTDTITLDVGGNPASAAIPDLKAPEPPANPLKTGDFVMTPKGQMGVVTNAASPSGLLVNVAPEGLPPVVETYNQLLLKQLPQPWKVGDYALLPNGVNAMITSISPVGDVTLSMKGSSVIQTATLDQLKASPYAPNPWKFGDKVITPQGNGTVTSTTMSTVSVKLEDGTPVTMVPGALKAAPIVPYVPNAKLITPNSPLYVPPVSAQSLSQVAQGPLIPASSRLDTLLGYDHSEMIATHHLGASEAALPGPQQIVPGTKLPQTIQTATYTVSGGNQVKTLYAVSTTGSLVSLVGAESLGATAKEVNDATWSELLDLAQKTAQRVDEDGNVMAASRLYVIDAVLDAHPGMKDLLLRAGGTDFRVRPAEGQGGGFFDALGPGVRLEGPQAETLANALLANTEDPLLQGQVLAAIPKPPQLVDLPKGVLANQPIKIMGGTPDNLWLAGGETIRANGLRAVSSWAGGKVEAEWLRTGPIMEWTNLTIASGTTEAEVTASTVRMLHSLLSNIAATPGTVLEVDQQVLSANPALRDLLLRYKGAEAATTSRAWIRVTADRANMMRQDIEAEMGASSAAGTVATPIVAPTIWPVPQDLKLLSAKGLGGQSPKAAFIDSQGNEWMFKIGASGRGARTDVAVNQLAGLLDLRTPPVKQYTLEINGKMTNGALQKLVPDIEHVKSPGELTPDQTTEFFQQSVLDWLTANDDAHIGNWMVSQSDGHLWGIDKTRSWVGMGGKFDTLDPANEGQGGEMGLLPMWSMFWRDARKNPALLANVDPKAIARTLGHLEAMSDQQFLQIIQPVLNDWKGLRQKSYDAFREAALLRKNQVRGDYQTFFASEVKAAMAGPKGADVPQSWRDWLLQDGGVFRLQLTYDEQHIDKMAEWDRDLLPSPTTDPLKEARRLLDPSSDVPGRPSKSSMQEALGYVHSYSGSGMSGEKTVEKMGSARTYGAGLIASKTDADAYAYASKINQWAVLHATFDPRYENSSVQWIKDIRNAYDPATGTWLWVRNVADTTDAQAYYERLSRLGYPSGRGGSLGLSAGFVQDAGVMITAKMNLENFYATSFVNPSWFQSTEGEREIIARDLQLPQIIRLSKYDGSMWNNEARKAGMDPWEYTKNYSGPVVQNSTSSGW